MNKRQNDRIQALAFCWMIPVFIFIAFCIATGFFGKSVSDSLNWIKLDTCFVDSYNIQEKMVYNENNYIGILNVNFKTKENLPINTQITLNQQNNYIQSQQEIYSLINDDPLNKTITCYYIINNPLIASAYTVKPSTISIIAFTITLLLFLFSCLILCITSYIIILS